MIKLFTHTDLDGVGCAILAYLAFGKDNVDVEFCNYDDIEAKVMAFCSSKYVSEITKDYDMIYITDISVKKETATYISNKFTLPEGINWKLLDHHATAMYLNDFEWCIVEPTDMLDIEFKNSGTWMFYLELFDKCVDRQYIKNIREFSDLVRIYDTWKWRELGAYGLKAKTINDLMYIYGKELFIDWVINNICSSSRFPTFTETDQMILNLEKGKIERYIEKKDKEMILRADSWGHLYGLIFAEQYISELGNRLCEMHHEIDYVAIVNAGAGTISYRTIRDDLDLGNEIAHSYGGGGHQKAAGSTFNKTIAFDKFLDYAMMRFM